MEKKQIIGLSVSLGLVVLFASLYKFYSSKTENVTINNGLYPDDLDKMLNKNIFGNNDNDNDNDNDSDNNSRSLSTNSSASTNSSLGKNNPYIPAGGSRRRKRSKKRKTKKRSTRQRR
jgi:hypothetical protein